MLNLQQPTKISSYLGHKGHSLIFGNFNVADDEKEATGLALPLHVIIQEPVTDKEVQCCQSLVRVDVDPVTLGASGSSIALSSYPSST